MKARSNDKMVNQEKISLMEDSKAKEATSKEIPLGKDLPNMVLLIILYLLQGIPLGLAMGSVPYLLKKQKLSYAQLATFSLAAYPYSLKLLWSPVVDSIYFKAFGRRKSWIIPVQVIVGVFLMYLGSWVDDMLASVSLKIPSLISIKNELDTTYFTMIFILLVFFSATQDIAVDGWALELLSEEHISYASTSQTIGLNSGYFLSYTIFLAFNSASFCNSYLRTDPSDTGMVSLGNYMWFWGIIYLAVTFLLLFFPEKESSSEDSMTKVYTDIWRIMTLPNMITLVIILLISKIGFVADDNISGFKYMEKGWKEEDLGLTSLINFPLQIIFGYYAARWSQGERKLKPWLYAFYGRMFMAIVDTLTVYYFPEKMSNLFFVWVIMTYVLCNFVRTVQFVSLGAFFAVIADPTIGGTYMTLLNTLSNLGGTFYSYPALQSVDFFTVAECTIPGTKEVFSCVLKDQKSKCKEMGGTCTLFQDGYYATSILCILIGIVTLLIYIKPNIKKLETIPPKHWRLKNKV